MFVNYREQAPQGGQFGKEAGLHRLAFDATGEGVVEPSIESVASCFETVEGAEIEADDVQVGAARVLHSGAFAPGQAILQINMSGLRNIRHERFAQAVASGKANYEAYLLAGFTSKSEKTARVNSTRLLAKPDIRTRVDELIALAREKSRAAVARAAERSGITKGRVIEELAKLAFSNVQDYLRSTEDGTLYADFSNLTRDQAAAIQSVEIEEWLEGPRGDKRPVRKVKFKLADKRQPLVDIGKELGMFIDRREDRLLVEQRLMQMTPEERAEDARQLLSEVKQALADYRAAEAAEATAAANSTDAEFVEVEAGERKPVG